MISEKAKEKGFWKDNIFYVLLEPQEPGNIGASARALKNMGFGNLLLVNPGEFLTDEARNMACRAKDVLERAVSFPDIFEAIKDKHLIVGTSRRRGKARGRFLPFDEGICRIRETSERNKVAVIFGRENIGLTNAESSQCGFILTIPTDVGFPSINLAQSVLLIAYELNKTAVQKECAELLDQAEMNRLYKRIRSVLNLLEYMPQGDRDLEEDIMQNIRQLFNRAGLTEWEMNMLHGLCTQIEKKVKPL
jgi:TrmH family RNA methyltransferase